ncbi:hypothetical protein WJX72_000519 [[Myrmecia] bisecta]|uniref:Uncharacterized protein n=1 Tax=[Myrmecia] bisecta TaxID=41462 RepID=A0AAW1P2P4_9CHLO
MFGLISPLCSQFDVNTFPFNFVSQAVPNSISRLPTARGVLSPGTSGAFAGAGGFPTLPSPGTSGAFAGARADNFPTTPTLTPLPSPPPPSPPPPTPNPRQFSSKRINF